MKVGTIVLRQVGSGLEQTIDVTYNCNMEPDHTYITLKPRDFPDVGTMEEQIPMTIEIDLKLRYQIAEGYEYRDMKYKFNAFSTTTETPTLSGGGVPVGTFDSGTLEEIRINQETVYSESKILPLNNHMFTFTMPHGDETLNFILTIPI